MKINSTDPAALYQVNSVSRPEPLDQASQEQPQEQTQQVEDAYKVEISNEAMQASEAGSEILAQTETVNPASRSPYAGNQEESRKMVNLIA